MSRSLMSCSALAVASVGLWLVVSILSKTTEPWDAPFYWTIALPVSALVAAAIGFRCDRNGWLAGAIVTWTQFPAMVVLSGIGSMSVFGMILLGALSIPIAALSAAAGAIGRRSRHGRHIVEAVDDPSAKGDR